MESGVLPFFGTHLFRPSCSKAKKYDTPFSIACSLLVICNISSIPFPSTFINEWSSLSPFFHFLCGASYQQIRCLRSALILVGLTDDKGCLKLSLAEVPELKPPAALTVEQISGGTDLLPGKIISICPPDSSKQKKEEQAAGQPLCDAGQITLRRCHRRRSMSEQFPRVYSGSKEGGCLWEEAVVTEAKTKKPPQLRWRQPTPF